MTRDDYEILFQHFLGTLDTKTPQSCLTELGQMCATYDLAGHWDIIWGEWNRVLGIDAVCQQVEVVGEFDV